MSTGITDSRSAQIAAFATPVLFIVFNRPDTTRRVFEAIRRVRPVKLYVAADGPRAARPGETARCVSVREIATQVDWDCQVRTLFRDKNLGVRRAVAGAIDWLFQYEESGIILEDDCFPSDSFFPFCEELLARYRDDTRVMAISGSNFQEGRCVQDASYYLSKYAHIWGWATWRRAWSMYDSSMAGWPQFRESRGVRAFADGTRFFESFWRHAFDATARGYIDTWDYVWQFSCWARDGLTCLPTRNLVKNIGFNVAAAHTPDPNSWLAHLPLEHMEFPLRHPERFLRNIEADARSDARVFRISAVAIVRRELVAVLPFLYRLKYWLRNRASLRAQARSD